MQEALRKALAATIYYHRMEVQASAVSRLQRAAAAVFQMQSYDALLAYWHADLAEASKEEDEDRRVAVILAAVALALSQRTGRDLAALAPGLEDALQAAVTHSGLARYGISANLRAIRAEEYLRTHGGELVQGLNEHTLERLRSALVAGFRAGEGAEGMAARITGLFDDMTEARAYKIAVTEANKAWSYAETEQARVMEQAGYQLRKEWLLNPAHPHYDECDLCADAGPLPLAAMFPIGVDAPPAHPSCGCALVTYPDPGHDQPWGAMVLGQTPVLMFGNDQGGAE
jgi:hypothetical protein